MRAEPMGVAARAVAQPGAVADRRVAGIAIALMGLGVVLALAGAATADLPLAAGGGALAGAALVVVLGARWLDPMLVVALAAPLPAIWSAAGVRVAAAAPVTAAALAGWALSRAAANEPIDAGRLPMRVLGALGLVLIVASVASPSPALALRELLNLVMMGGLLVCATAWFVESPRSRPRVAEALALLTVGCAALAVLEAVGVIPGQFPRWETAYQRAALGFGQPNGLGLFLALGLPLVAWRAGTARTPGALWGWRAALAVTALGLLGTFSRGSWASVIAGTLVLALAGEWRRTARMSVLALVGVVALDVVSGGMIRDTIERTIGDWIIEQRAALTLAGILMFLDRPLLGMGPGGFESQLDSYGILIPELFDFQPTPHNAYIQWAAESGAPGLIVYAYLVHRIARVGAREVRRAAAEDPEQAELSRALLWSFGVLLVSGLFLWPYAHGTGQAAVLVMALLLSVPEPARAGAG